MSDSAAVFVRHLAGEFTAVADLLERHIGEYEELLPHVFMGDLTRYVLQDGPHRVDIVQYIDNVFAQPHDDNVDNLIAVSFVENLWSPEEFAQALKGVAGDALRQEWERQHST